jgi:hypothetical protein
MKETKRYTTQAIFYCDNEAVTITTNKNILLGTSTKDYYKPDFDIISKIISIWKKLKKKGVHIKVRHILGHQDKQNKKYCPTPKKSMYQQINWLQWQ